MLESEAIKIAKITAAARIAGLFKDVREGERGKDLYQAAHDYLVNHFKVEAKD